MIIDDDEKLVELENFDQQHTIKIKEVEESMHAISAKLCHTSVEQVSQQEESDDQGVVDVDEGRRRKRRLIFLASISFLNFQLQHRLQPDHLLDNTRLKLTSGETILGPFSLLPIITVVFVVTSCSSTTRTSRIFPKSIGAIRAPASSAVLAPCSTYSNFKIWPAMCTHHSSL